MLVSVLFDKVMGFGLGGCLHRAVRSGFRSSQLAVEFISGDFFDVLAYVFRRLR